MALYSIRNQPWQIDKPFKHVYHESYIRYWLTSKGKASYSVNYLSDMHFVLSCKEEHGDYGAYCLKFIKRSFENMMKEYFIP